jgi:hypothetical protein
MVCPSTRSSKSAASYACEKRPRRIVGLGLDQSTGSPRFDRSTSGRGMPRDTDARYWTYSNSWPYCARTAEPDLSSRKKASHWARCSHFSHYALVKRSLRITSMAPKDLTALFERRRRRLSARLGPAGNAPATCGNGPGLGTEALTLRRCPDPVRKLGQSDSKRIAAGDPRRQPEVSPTQQAPALSLRAGGIARSSCCRPLLKRKLLSRSVLRTARGDHGQQIRSQVAMSSRPSLGGNGGGDLLQ